MTLSLQLTSGISKANLWLAAHPQAVRATLITLPIVITLLVVLLAPASVFACPGSGGSCGG